MFSVSAQHFRQAFVQHGQTPHPTPRPHPRLPGHHGGPQRTLEEHASGGHQGSSCRPSLHLPQKRGETNHLFSSSASCVLSALAPNTADGLPRTDSLFLFYDVQHHIKFSVGVIISFYIPGQSASKHSCGLAPGTLLYLPRNSLRSISYAVFPSSHTN